MNDMPSWWLFLSATFFAMNVLLFFALAFALFKISKAMQEMMPKVTSLTAKVEVLTEKVSSLADSAKTTVDHVGGRARNVAGSAESIASVASSQFERFAPILMGGLTALKLIGAFRSMKQKGGGPKALQEAIQSALTDD